MSADGYGYRGSWRDPERLDVQWQPRSASALDGVRPSGFDGPVIKRKVSFEDEVSYQDEESVLDMDDDDEEVEDDHSRYLDVEDDRSVYQDVEDDRPQTAYDESDAGDRSSIWSQAESRKSFFDEEKSATARERFVKQVEAMYGEYTVPPVPPLNVAKPLKGGAAG